MPRHRVAAASANDGSVTGAILLMEEQPAAERCAASPPTDQQLRLFVAGSGLPVPGLAVAPLCGRMAGRAAAQQLANARPLRVPLLVARVW